MGKELARGAYGAVHKAVWRGTTVAVKVQLSQTLTQRDMNECATMSTPHGWGRSEPMLTSTPAQLPL